MTASNIETCKRVHDSIHSGDHISDEDLRTAIHVFRNVVGFVDGLQHRPFDLFEDHLRQDLRTLEGYQAARKRKD